MQSFIYNDNIIRTHKGKVKFLPSAPVRLLHCWKEGKETVSHGLNAARARRTMLGSSSSSQRPQRHYSTKKVQSLLHASHPLTPWSYIWKKQIFSTGVISYSQVSNHEGPHQANIITSRGFVKIWQELLSPKHIFACCSKPSADKTRARLIAIQKEGFSKDYPGIIGQLTGNKVNWKLNCTEFNAVEAIWVWK